MSANEWKSDMDRMLAKIERESTQSLRKINQCFIATHRPFNEEFRKYFLKMATLR